ncbi:sensor histidine kinase [Galbibacter pacificus]|uniref:Sensor histidine kinase n=1 Tax=Galbibacter pacificus TaxID=2996052 RepID=A0ABT6FUZ0_9FLAO|nr:sensor histidine kinase [Galbibacter pacificus]MDG3583434.1 sensor histidine kinase [Galbibacter pacificus]MDG3587089.1 sensor histidine kinase [Galbibacter pacificus]
MENKQSIKKEIILHILVWSCLYGVMLFQSYSRTGVVDVFSNLSPRFLVNIVLFYLNYYVLVPYFLLKKRILIYVLISVFVILVCSYLVDTFLPPEFPIPGTIPGRHSVMSIRAHSLDGFPLQLSKDDIAGNIYFKFRMLIGPTINLMFYFIIGAIIRMYVEWNKNERVREKTEHEKVHSELQFLKTQLNPHFLFNSLNAVYTLSIKKSSDTPEAILNLSELMRYMIYEANKDMVSLEKELNYIHNYIQLQRLRLSNHERVTINIYGDAKGKVIRPLLFISFIENAFKYGTDYKGNTEVKINITINNDNVFFFIKNKIGIIKKSPDSSGIGLQNVQNRLKLLYPGRHELKIENDGDYYSISLTIYIAENEMYNN